MRIVSARVGEGLRCPFVRAVGLAALAALAASSCGAPGPARVDAGPVGLGGADGGSRTGTMDGGGPPADTLDLEGSLSDLVALANSQVDGTFEAKRAGILAFIRSRPEYRASGMGKDGVWAIFSNGIPLMVFDNMPPDGTPGGGQKMHRNFSKSDVPKGTPARMITTLGNGYADTTTAIGELLMKKGYAPYSDDGTVESLRHVSGDGVFFFTTHGGECEVSVYEKGEVVRGSDGTPVTAPSYCLATRTRVNNSSASEYAADLRSGTLGVAVMPTDYDATKTRLLHDKLYMITSLWPDAYWSFAKDALVWINSCGSNSPLADSLKQSSTSRQGQGCT